jgi:hypothetical protein
MQNLNLKKMVKVILCLIVVGAGFYAGKMQQKNIQISYISQSEILEMENNRVQAQDLNSRQLFFGKPERAIKVIESIQKLESTSNNVILLSEDKIYGKDVNSISKAVHARIIQELRND